MLKNAEDLREVMDGAEQNASQTIQQLEMSVAELQNAVFEIRQVIIGHSIDPDKCVNWFSILYPPAKDSRDRL